MKNRLIEEAVKVMENSYSPYSKFRVGAAVLGDDGSVYVGTNVENASYGLAICAERSAVFNAVANGVKTISECAVVTETVEPAAPCGACRQVLLEFSNDMIVHLANSSGVSVTYKLSELAPLPFTSIELE